MKKEDFDRVANVFLSRRPFRPFTLELTSGSRIEVNHPEALTIQNEFVVCMSTSGRHSVFECGSVVRFIDATGVT